MHMKELPATVRRISDECRKLGLERGDVVMVHVSLRTVGPVLGGADALTDGILDAIGADGTMMVYVGCDSPFDDVGRGICTREEEAFILEHCPVFDPQSSRACREFGAFAELFRTRPGVRCSNQVSSRVAAIGAKADVVLAMTSLDYSLGKGSPLEDLCEENGKLLLLGSDLDHVTLLHYAEALAPIGDKRVVHIRVPLNVDGKREWVDIAEFDSMIGIRMWEDRFFAHTMEKFIGAGHASAGAVANAQSHLFRARDLIGFAIPVMVDAAKQLDASARLKETDRKR